MNAFGTRAYEIARSSLTLGFTILFVFLLAGCGNYTGGVEEEEEITTLQASSGMSQLRMLPSSMHANQISYQLSTDNFDK